MPYAIDPELAPFVELIPPLGLRDPASARASLDALLAPLNASVDLTGVDVEDCTIPGPEDAPEVLVRIYRSSAADGPRPAFIDIHGGGFIVGSIEMQLAGSAALARALDVVVVTPEYRLAPEHPFPAGLEDCYATLTWVHQHADELGVDAAHVGIGGQSAGGGLAAALALLARDRGGPPVCFQLLGIPELDHRAATTSMRTFVDTPLLTRDDIVASWAHYLGPDPGEVSHYASPALADDLTDLPPAYVATMELDPLRDEGIAYALRLLEAGISVELHSFPGTFHGSSIMTTAAVSRRAEVEQLAAIERGLGLTPPPA
ncbi:MAG: alpha/beta hydrolase [Acidimicrobiales bacterium]|nr:alpha/beta hydrolase [Acidimicrobiales bacterium]